MCTLADFLTGIEHCIYGGTHINTPSSVTRLGDLMDFGPLFKAFGNNNLPKSPTLGTRQFFVKIYHVYVEISFG